MQGNKMSMGPSAPHSCKISMLWNWYTVDSCFIARSWHVRSKGAFAASCVGVFFLVVASQWLHRFVREYDVALINKYENNTKLSESKLSETSSDLPTAKSALVSTLSHLWLLKSVSPHEIKATPLEHLFRCFLFTVEWGLSYLIMLLFMYYNGFIIISCILGAFAGRLLFTYNEPLNQSCLADSQDMDKKCCR